jgi:glycosyltransferase involved in cell wall biosynthesis
MRPQVSVITPFLNAEAFLHESIASVQHQTLGDWELLLIDDGSSDKSSAIATAAAAGDSRIRLLRRSSELSKGAAAARNIGVQNALGEYIAFLDADDIYEDEALNTYLTAIKGLPVAVAMVYGSTRWWSPDRPISDWTEHMKGQAGRTHSPPSLLIRILLQMADVPCTCGVLIRRRAIETVGGFDERFQLYEDQTLWVKLLLQFPAHVLNYCGARYRQHNASTSARAITEGRYHSAAPHDARAGFLEWVQRYIYDTSTPSLWLNLAVHLARAPYIEERGVSDQLFRLAWNGFVLLERRRRYRENA